MFAAAPVAAVAAPVPAIAPSASAVNIRTAMQAIAAQPSAFPAVAAIPAVFRQALPLDALVAANTVGAELNAEALCLATAVYFEARGESLQGQLAVANVVLNRARSDRYPPSWCDVVKQPWQFSFVRNGRFPPIDYGSHSWATAQAIARIASMNLAAEVEPDVLWYHADYVAPSWGKRLQRVSKIGAHIFYRS